MGEKVDFEVVKIYKNDIYTPYSLKPKNGDSCEGTLEELAKK